MTRVMRPKIGLQGRVSPRNPSLATRWISAVAVATSAVAIEAIGDIRSLYWPKVSHAQSFQILHCAVANSASLVAHIVSPLLGK